MTLTTTTLDWCRKVLSDLSNGLQINEILELDVMMNRIQLRFHLGRGVYGSIFVGDNRAGSMLIFHRTVNIHREVGNIKKSNIHQNAV